MALIMKADWTCEKNQCINLLNEIGLEKDCRWQVKSIPANWIIAQHMMHSLSFSLRETDQLYITKGDVSLSHVVHIYNHKISSRNPSYKINGTIFKTLQCMGINTIQDFGKWNIDKHGIIALQSWQVMIWSVDSLTLQYQDKLDRWKQKTRYKISSTYADSPHLEPQTAQHGHQTDWWY